MKKAIIFTDTYDLKKDAIYGVFFKKFDSIALHSGVSSFEGKTPLDLETLISETKKRLFSIPEKITGIQADYRATVQRGFHFTGSLWHLIARVGIIHVSGNMAMGFTASVPIPLKVSMLKTQNPTGNIKDFLEQEYPDFNKDRVSMFTYLTDEDEKKWFQEPLRYCLKAILR